jgi:hypothetical protein
MTKNDVKKGKSGNGKGKDLDNYAEVKDRIRIFYSMYPDGRIVTELLSWEGSVVTFRAKVYKNREDQEANCPVGVGHAYEEEDVGYVNKTSVVENCETSAVGRALANAGISTDKAIASKLEVQIAMERLKRMRENGTYEMPADVRRKFQEFVKLGVAKGLDHNFLYKVAEYTRGKKGWSIEAVEDAIKVVESYKPGEASQEEVLKQLKEINRKLHLAETAVTNG